MKDLAADESLSEEARDSARKALEVLVSSQLLDIEQAAALKKLDLPVEVRESKLVLIDDWACASKGAPLTAAQAKMLDLLERLVGAFDASPASQAPLGPPGLLQPSPERASAVAVPRRAAVAAKNGPRAVAASDPSGAVQLRSQFSGAAPVRSSFITSRTSAYTHSM